MSEKKKSLNLNRQGEIRLDMASAKDSGKGRVVINSILASIATISIVMGIVSGFDIAVSPIAVILAGVLASVFFQIIMTNKKICLIGSGAAVVLLGAFIGVCINHISNGFSGITNDVLRAINKNMAMAHLLFVENTNGLAVDKIMAMIVIVFGVACIVSVLIKIRWNMWLVLFVILGNVIGMLYKGSLGIIWMCLGMVSIYAILYFGNIKGRLTKDMYIFSGICTLGIMGASALVLLFVKYTGLATIDETKKAIVYNGGNIIYGKSDYPEGDFYKYSEVNPTGEKRLHVEMDKPEVMYLRGYVGSKYTKDGWQENDQNIYGGEYEGIFEYFAAQNYYPLTTSARYIDISREYNPDFEAQTTVDVQISNEGASTKYQYLPENITYTSLPGLYAPKKDVNFIAQGLGSSKAYSFRMEVVPSYNYETIYNETWYSEEIGDERFISCEQSYGYFASQNYKDIPEDMVTYFDSILPNAGKKLHPFDAIGMVRKYLKNNVDYSESTTAYTGGQDFVEDLLENKKMGYSADFATAAVMMFRYYGVPARYVEGYLAIPEDGETSFDILDTDAHAWVEIYVNGVGFIPVEVTPGFYEEESNGSGGGGGGGASNGGSSNSEQDQNDVDMKEDAPRVFEAWFLVIFIAVLIIGFITFVLVRRHLRVKKRKEAMEGADLELAIAVAGEYMSELLGAKVDLKKHLPADMLSLLERLKFSSDMPTAEEARYIVDYALKIKEEVYKTSTFAGKLKLRFVKCLV